MAPTASSVLAAVLLISASTAFCRVDVILAGPDAAATASIARSSLTRNLLTPSEDYHCYIADGSSKSCYEAYGKDCLSDQAYDNYATCCHDPNVGGKDCGYPPKECYTLTYGGYDRCKKSYECGKQFTYESQEFCAYIDCWKADPAGPGCKGNGYNVYYGTPAYDKHDQAVAHTRDHEQRDQATQASGHHYYQPHSYKKDRNTRDHTTRASTSYPSFAGHYEDCSTYCCGTSTSTYDSYGHAKSLICAYVDEYYSECVTYDECVYNGYSYCDEATECAYKPVYPPVYEDPPYTYTGATGATYKPHDPYYTYGTGSTYGPTYEPKVIYEDPEIIYEPEVPEYDARRSDSHRRDVSRRDQATQASGHHYYKPHGYYKDQATEASGHHYYKPHGYYKDQATQDQSTHASYHSHGSSQYSDCTHSCCYGYGKTDGHGYEEPLICAYQNEFYSQCLTYDECKKRGHKYCDEATECAYQPTYYPPHDPYKPKNPPKKYDRRDLVNRKP